MKAPPLTQALSRAVRLARHGALLSRRAACAALLTSASLAAHAQPVSFQDMQGSPIVLEQASTRAVTLPMPAGSMWLSLARDPRKLHGMHPDSYTHMRQGLLARMFPGAQYIRADVTRSGFVPNVESLLQMQPDLIWQWGHMGDELLAPLRQAGLTVAALLYGDEARVREWIRLMGTALGETARAEAQLAWRLQVEQQLRAVTDSLTPQEQARVMLLSRYAPQHQVAGGSGNFQFDVSLAGGRNVAEAVGNANIVNIEQIMAWDPEVILLNNFENGLTPDTLYQDPMFADISAVREHRVYKIPAGGYRWDPPGQESPLYWLWLSQILHPEKFNWPMRDLIREQFMQLYGYQASDADLDQVLHLQLNAQAQGYERFKP